jgi:uncharacterized protein YcfJ
MIPYPSTDRLKKLMEAQRKQPGSLSYGTEPTSAQVATDEAIRQEKLKVKTEYEDSIKNADKKAAVDNEGQVDATKSGNSPIRRLLTVLNMPAAVGSGVVESLAGTGAKSGILENVKDNVMNRGSYGDVLRAKGVTNAVSAPLGFVADVALDPLNWVTAGTTALVPRIANGAVAGGVKGAALGAKSGLLQKVSAVARSLSTSYSDSLSRNPEIAGEAAAKVPAWLKSVAQKNEELSKAYEVVTNNGIDRLEQYADGMNRGLSATWNKLGTAAERNGFASKVMGFAKNFVTNSDQAFTDAMAKSEARNAVRKPLLDEVIKNEKANFQAKIRAGLTPEAAEEFVSGLRKGAEKAADVAAGERFGNSVTQGLDRAQKLLLDPASSLAGRTFNDFTDTARWASMTEDEVETSRMLATEVGKMADQLTDPAQRAAYLAKNGEQKASDILKKINTYYSFKVGEGATSYNKALVKALESKIARTYLSTYARAGAIFRVSAIGASPTSWVNASVDNLAKLQMAGVNVANRQLHKMIGSSVRLNYGGDLGQLSVLFREGTGWKEFAREHGPVFESMTGMNAKLAAGGPEFVMKEIKRFSELALNADTVEARKVYKEMADEFGEAAAKVWQRAGFGEPAAAGAAGSQAGAMSKSAKEAVKYMSAQQGETFIMGANSFAESDVRAFINELKRKADGGNRLAGFAHSYMTKPLQAYGKIDSSARLAGAAHMVSNGLTRAEMTKVMNWFPDLRFGEEVAGEIPKGVDFVRGKGDVYFLSPESALRVVNNAFLNYSALPEFLQVIKKMPMLGSPFLAYCRDEKTEILTRNGFKTHDLLDVGEEVLSINQQTKELEWKEVEKVNVFDFDGELVHLGHRSLDILMTDNHTCLVAKKPVGEGPRNQEGKRTRTSGDWEISRKVLAEFGNKDSIVAGAEKGYVGCVTKNYSDEEVELAAWLVTEGSYSKSRKGERSGFYITQSKPEGVERIKALRSRLGLREDGSVTKAEVFNRRPGSFRANHDVHNWHFPGKFYSRMEEMVPDKTLSVKFLNELTRDQLELLYEVLVLADGHVNKRTGESFFFQNRGETADTFQVLCLMIGKTSSAFYSEKRGENLCVSICDKVYRQVKRMKITREQYRGKVWCPTVKDNANWVARKNGKIDITGNSMAASTNYAKAIGVNPAYFVHVMQMMNEVSGERTPLEKANLQSKYYAYLDKEGIVKLPFFENNPMYLNMSNMFSHLSLQMAQGPQRSYGDKYGDRIAKMIDQTPFFKQPDGQVVLDNVIMPLLISEGIAQNSFGIPLYNSTDTVPEKAGKAVSSFASSFVPRVAGLTGLLGTPLPKEYEEAVVPYVPSYPWKKLRNAREGRTASGMPGKEEPTSRVVRGVLSEAAGLPTYKMNFEYSAKGFEKDKNK